MLIIVVEIMVSFVIIDYRSFTLKSAARIFLRLRLTTVFSHRDLCDQFNGAIIEIPIEEENPDS